MSSGSRVTFELVPSNIGPADALPGWSVTDVLPDGLTLVSMSGSGYTCTGATCVAVAGLAAGMAGPTITVVATVDATATGQLRNVAYISPSADEVAEGNPLVVPTNQTDTSSSPTNNDAEAVIVVAAPVTTGLPATGAESSAVIGFGALLLLLGAGLTYTTRRRGLPRS